MGICGRGLDSIPVKHPTVINASCKLLTRAACPSLIGWETKYHSMGALSCKRAHRVWTESGQIPIYNEFGVSPFMGTMHIEKKTTHGYIIGV